MNPSPSPNRSPNLNSPSNQVDAALRAHEPSLRVLYRQYASGQVQG